MRKLVLATTAIAAICGFAGSAAAQSFPSRPITMIVPFAAGGPTDVIARVVGERHAGSRSGNRSSSRTSPAPAARIARRARRPARRPTATRSTSATWSHARGRRRRSIRLQYDVFRDFDPVVWLIARRRCCWSSRKDVAGERSAGAGRLAEEQIRPSARSAAPGRQPIAGRGRFAPATDRREDPVRALSRRRRRPSRTSLTGQNRHRHPPTRQTTVPQVSMPARSKATPSLR